MEVYLSNLYGKWKREDTGAVYDFGPNGEVIVNGKYHMGYSIVTARRESTLIIRGQAYGFVVMDPRSFTVWQKSGMVTFNRVTS